LEVGVRLLTNPLFVRAIALFVCSAAAFVVGAVAMRMLRHRMVDGEMPDTSGAEQSLPLQAYTVIQQLKQQKFALQNEQQQQRRRSKTSEHITSAIIANLPVGMMFVAPNGLVRQANASARRILGFASPMGMSVAQVFHDARAFTASGSEIKVTDAFADALHGRPHDDVFQTWYATPSGEERSLEVTLIAVQVAGGEILGLASVIADRGEAAALRQAQVIRAEESAELALKVRTSLSTIREWAEQMKADGNSGMRGLAGDISAEAGHLEKVVGQFLAGNEKAKGAHA
jgi:PAS domain S-box-containing protein